MSLAATLAAHGGRPTSFLPTIKCSNCGDEIEISAMGDHTCAKAPSSPKAAPPSLTNPFTLRQLNASNSKPTQPSPLQFNSPPTQTRARAPTIGSTAGQPTASKTPRIALPQINPDAANKPFLGLPQRSDSPVSPALSSRSGSSVGSKPPPPLRSMTSPMPRLWDQRPPSPDLPGNLDCAFPPFPFGDSGSRRPSASSGRRTPTGSERGSSRSTSRQEGGWPLDFAVSEPQSPGCTAELSLNSKFSARRSGLSDRSRRPSDDDRPHPESKPLDRRRPSLHGMAKRDDLPSLPLVANSNNATTPQPISSYMVQSSRALGTTTDTSVGEKKARPERPARPAESLTPSLIDKMIYVPAASIASDQTQAANAKERLPTTPDDTAHSGVIKTITKMPSEPALKASKRRPTLTSATQSEPSQVPQIPPPRSQSREGNRMDYRMQDAPPVPKPIQLARSNSQHRPSGSDSSTASSINSTAKSNSSDGPSPTGSAASSVEALLPLTSEAAQYGEDQGMRVAGLNVKNQEKPGMRAEQRTGRPHSLRRAAKVPTREDPMPVERPRLPSISNGPLESPMDPAMKNGKLAGDQGQSTPSSPLLPDSAPRPLEPASNSLPIFNFNFNDDYDPYRSHTTPPPAQKPSHGRSRSKSENFLENKTFERPVPTRSQTAVPVSNVSPLEKERPKPQMRSPPAVQPPPVPQTASRPGLARRQTTGTKAVCRGCNKQIEGKSVKAADGRLTGRWHKACFTCKTCKEPFTTADFYVINNHPYCEQHYHEKNGSVCHACQKGIEGQYLETSSAGAGGRVERKYHARCFTCVDCRVILSDDYFEIGSRIYCERHALAAMRGQAQAAKAVGAGLVTHGASNLRAERRTTKLMTTS